MLGAGDGLAVLEQAMRAALATAGAALLEAVLSAEDGNAGSRAGCGCGGQAAYAGVRDKTVTTVLGPVRLKRAWYHCRECKHGFAPRDQQLGIGGGSLSPGLSEMIALAGAEVSFARAAALLAGLAGVTISPRTIERSAEATGAAARAAAGAEAAAIRTRTIIPLPPPEPVPDMLYAETDGTGVPVRASETEGRQGKSEDGKAGTREVKLARLFTVSRLDEDGRPVMDPGSSTYVATFDGKDALAELVQAEYLRRGGEHFRQVVAIGDGAAWIWTMAGKLYPHATHIVDIYHAREHLHDLAAHLAFITPDPAQWLQDRNADLDAGNIKRHHQRRPLLPPRRHQGQRPGQEARLLRAQRAPDALPALPRPGHVHRVRCHRGRHQRDRRPARETVRHALDRQRRGRHPRAALPARQRPVERLRRAPRSRPGPGTPHRRLTDTATQNPEAHGPVKIIPNKAVVHPRSGRTLRRHPAGLPWSAEELQENGGSPGRDVFVGEELRAYPEGRLGGIHLDDTGEETKVIDVAGPGGKCLHGKDVAR